MQSRKIHPVLERARHLLSPLKPLVEGLAQLECVLAAAWARSAHRRLMFVQWALPPQPENFDHHIDLYLGWLTSRNPQWVERGVYGALALKGSKVLDLCCGDGFNARNFYSLASESVIACDFDPLILRTARRKNSAPNVKFVEADIRTSMPEGKFGNIMWDAAIEHFTPSEIEQILNNIKSRLEQNGILSGHTIVENQTGEKQLSHHEYEFKDKEDLKRFLTPHFRNVWVWETIYPTRHNLYFWASDGPIPFFTGFPKTSGRFLAS